MARCSAALYVALALILAVAAIAIGRLRCEGFGCTGLGIAWLAWVAAYMVVLVGGIMVRARPTLGTSLARVTSAVVLLQGLCGIGLALVWAARSAA